MEMTEAETLEALLKEDWHTFSYDGGSFQDFTTVEVIEGDARRWSRSDTVITQGPSGAHYMWFFEKGLTEMQENEYWPEKVKPVRKTSKMVEVTSWVDDI